MTTVKVLVEKVKEAAKKQRADLFEQIEFIHSQEEERRKIIEKNYLSSNNKWWKVKKTQEQAKQYAEIEIENRKASIFSYNSENYFLRTIGQIRLIDQACDIVFTPINEPVTIDLDFEDFKLLFVTNFNLKDNQK